MAETVQIARKAVEVAADKQASDILLLDLRGLVDFTDYFVILTADNPRQLATLADELEGQLEQAGGRRHHREGEPDCGWIVLDFGDLVLHLFSTEQRQYYQLERIWNRAVPLLRVQ
ncbi:MAG: ribosome silencing factor [Chloroflexi bacterium]|nr:ribosome silencing factor [Chloroflexota bacterium]